MNRNQKHFKMPRFADNGKKLLLPVVFCIAAFAALYAVTAPVAQHIALAAGAVKSPALAVQPDLSDLPQYGALDIEDYGGWPEKGEALGTVRIAGTAVDCTLYYGDASEQLHAGAGIWAGGHIPGQGSTVLVAGHTNTFFRDLESVEEGDDIAVETRYGEYHYRVTGMRVAMEDDTSAYDLDAAEENIILYTCYPFGQITVTPQRYFVYGEYVSGPMLKESRP